MTDKDYWKMIDAMSDYELIRFQYPDCFRDKYRAFIKQKKRIQNNLRKKGQI